MKINPNVVVITANNLISRIMLLRLMNRHADKIKLIIVVPNLNLSTRRGLKTTKKWLHSASFYFYYMKFIEIFLDTAIARLRGNSIVIYAHRKNIEVVRLKSQNEILIQNLLLEVHCDYLFSMGPAILSKDVISIPRELSINVHGGDLPKYRGLSNYVWMLLAGETHAVVTMHEIIEKIDAGRIMQKIDFPIAPEWSAFRLNVEMAKKQSDLVSNFLSNGLHFAFLETNELSDTKYYGLPSANSIRNLNRIGRKLITIKDLGLLIQY
jgi:folate-dependent phosphoribosylglycinamide formyltransferase PurN